MASTLEEAKKFIEGWTSYKSEQAKGSKKCWMVLRGTSIFLFSSDKPNKEMLGSLSLGPGTCMTDIKSKREFKFELAATNREGQFQKGVFKFNKESDYHLWKAYIVAISTGSIPTDVRLLPAQQSDVYEAMVEVRKKSNSGAGNTAASSGRRQTHPLPSHPLPSPSQNPPSPGRHLDDAEDADAEDDDDPAIRQLTKRLEELAEREINDREVTASVTSWPINEIMETVRPKGGPSSSSSFSVSSSRAVATADATVGSAPPPPTTTNSANQNSTTTQSKRTSFLFANHVFYSGGVRNSNATPSWFVNCSREQAEEILASERFGTVLMRASSGFPFNGNYVISFRREFQGKVVVSHYNILRTEDGFKLDVENQHAPMHSLSVVMDFFSSAAGKSAKPLTSNDLTELLGKYQAEAFPAVVGKETVQRRSVGSSSVHSFDRDSFHSQPPTTTLSSRSSFADGQSSSSFDLSGGGGGSRRTSDAHAHRLPFNADDRRNSSASSSSVFYHHHQNHVTELVGGSASSSPPPPPPSSYGGSFTGSVNGSGSVTTKDPYYSGNRSLSIEEDAAPANDDDDQIYSNQSETIAVPPDSGASGGGGEEQRHRASVGHRGSDGTLRSSVGLDRRGFDATQISRTSWEQQQQQQQQQQQPQQLNASYGGTAASRRQQQQQQQQSPPAPPPKPGPHEIYQLMKPLPPSAAEGEYSSSGASSEIYRASSNGVNLEAPTSVKELARMLQCSLEK